MSLGDLHNNREKLRSELRIIKYSEPIDIKSLNEGEASSTLPIIHFCLLSYSKVFAEYIIDQGFDLMSSNDYNFLESVFRLLRQKFSYRPVLKIGQFLASGFAERKIMMLLDLINIVKTKTNELQRYQQAEEKKSKSPIRLIEEENIKIQTPPKPSSKVYKDPEEILMDYSNILKKNASVEKVEGQDKLDVQKTLEKLLEEQRRMKERILEQDEIITKMQKRHEADMAQYEARLHLLSSKVKLLEGNKKDVGKVEKKGQEEGLLSKLGISNNQLAFRNFNDPSSDFFGEY